MVIKPMSVLLALTPGSCFSFAAAIIAIGLIPFMGRRWIALLLATAALSIACGGGGTGGGGEESSASVPTTYLRITPSDSYPQAGESRSLTAALVSPDGRKQPVEADWICKTPAIATLQ